jgi:hypothetical protein
MGQVLAGGNSRPITAEELRAIGQMQQAMTLIPVPTLRHADNPHEYLFFAFNDGSGQDLNKPKLGLPTNVGVLYEQARKLERDPSNRIGTHYAAGIGSQSFAPARWGDGALAVTWADGIEKMYREFAKQSDRWIRQDPEAKISVAGLGYSRGAVQEAGFHRLVEQYGIADPEGLKFGRDNHGNITVESSLPPLVPPGQVAQATFLLDPVATNMPRNYDARLPGSAISRVSLLAATEQRELFPHQAINDPGMSDDGLSLNVPVPGGHSNIGGGNKEPGVEILVGNMAVDYLNLLSDKPLFEKRPVPQDLSEFTIYQAQGTTAGWGLKIDHDGRRDLREELANCKIVDPCRDSEPINRDLAAKFEFRHITLDPYEQARLQGLIAQASAREQDAPTIAERQSDMSVVPAQPVSQVHTTPTIPEQLATPVPQASYQAGPSPSPQPAVLLRPFSDPHHPQHSLYADVKSRLQADGQAFSEERLSQVTAELHERGFTPGWRGGIVVMGDMIYARDADQPERRAGFETTQAAPPVEQTMQVIQDYNIAEQRRNMEERQQEMTRGTQAPTM